MPRKRFVTGSNFFRTGVGIAVLAAAVFCCPAMAAGEEQRPLQWMPTKELGYDGNGNGLWDDAEQYAILRARDKPMLRDLIMDLALGYQYSLLAKTPEDAYIAWAASERARNCLYEYFGKYQRQAKAIVGDLDLMLYGKTDLRNKAFFEFSALLEGQTLLEQLCETQ